MLRSFSLRDVLLVSHFSCNAVFSVSVVAAFKFSKNCFSHSLSSVKRDSTVFDSLHLDLLKDYSFEHEDF